MNAFNLAESSVTLNPLQRVSNCCKWHTSSVSSTQVVHFVHLFSTWWAIRCKIVKSLFLLFSPILHQFALFCLLFTSGNPIPQTTILLLFLRLTSSSTSCFNYPTSNSCEKTVGTIRCSFLCSYRCSHTAIVSISEKVNGKACFLYIDECNGIQSMFILFHFRPFILYSLDRGQQQEERKTSSNSTCDLEKWTKRSISLLFSCLCSYLVIYIYIYIIYLIHFILFLSSKGHKRKRY